MLVPTVTTMETLHTCLSKRVPVFAVEEPLYSLILSFLGGPSFFIDYTLELYPEKKIFIAKRSRFPHCFQPQRTHLVYEPLGWF